MAAHTKIGWCSYLHPDGHVVHGHTFNGWHGCAKKSRGCRFCYADTLSKRYGRHIWGRKADRIRTKAPWTDVHKWNQAAQKAGDPALVFASSMADVFEDHRQLPPWRADLWDVIEQTRWLVWLLLTKRPENIIKMVPTAWLAPGGWPANVWPGASLESQRYAPERIPPLIQLWQAPVRFLSVEPMVGRVDLTKVDCGPAGVLDALTANITQGPEPADTYRIGGPINWVIGGGESGGKGIARMHPVWLSDLAVQCANAHVPFFAKQTGTLLAHEWGLPGKGDNPAEWPDHIRDLWVQQHPTIHIPEATILREG